MAEILGIHGIGQQFRGGYQLRTLWYDALRDGLVAAAHRPVAETLAPSNVKVAFFGDLFRPRGTMAGPEPPFSAADIQPGLEREMLATLFEAALSQDPSLGPPRGSMGPGRTTVQMMLDWLARSTTLGRVAQRAFIGNLKQITAFLTNPTVKQDVLARVREQITKETRVMIGHSMGSVVAYEYLCQDQPASVALLVTVGSPLGIPNVIYDKLTPTPTHGRGAWPGKTNAWVNIADVDDIVALRKDLAPLFPGAVLSQMVVDRLADNGDEPHAIDRYLSSRQAGSALGDILA